MEYPKLGKPFRHGISKPLKNFTLKFFMATIHEIQAGLFLCDFFFHNFSLTWLENLYLFSNLHDSVQFNTIWCRQYMIICGLMQIA